MYLEPRRKSCHGRHSPLDRIVQRLSFSPSPNYFKSCVFLMLVLTFSKATYVWRKMQDQKNKQHDASHADTSHALSTRIRSSCDLPWYISYTRVTGVDMSAWDKLHTNFFLLARRYRHARPSSFLDCVPFDGFVQVIGGFQQRAKKPKPQPKL